MANIVKRSGQNRALVPDAESLDGWLAQQAAAGCAASFEQLVARLWTIAARLDTSRRRKRALPLVTWNAEVAASEPDAGTQLGAAEARDGLWALAAQVLRPAQRDALWLFYVEEMSVKEVAQVLHISCVGAKVLLHRARRRLGAALRQNTGPAPVFAACVEGVDP